MKAFQWLMESNRLKHLVYAIPCAVVGTILFTAGLAVGMEYKDKLWGGKFDWLDLAATMMGGVIGQLVQGIVVWAIVSTYTN